MLIGRAVWSYNRDGFKGAMAMYWFGASRGTVTTLVIAVFVALTHARSAWSSDTGQNQDETWTNVVMVDYGIELTVLSGDFADPDRAVWVGLASSEPGVDRGFSKRVTKELPGAVRFSLFWGATCIEGQWCDSERRFKLAVHHEGDVLCENEFSTAEVGGRTVIYELMESVDGCSITRLP